MRIALCQLDIVWEDKNTNRIKVSKYIRQASEQKVQLLLFPEMTLTGFSMNTAITAEAERETIDYFAGMARKNNIGIGFGWVAKRDDKAENHYTVLLPDGKVISDYIKIHPFSYSGEDQYFYGGKELTHFSIGEFQISTFICYDLRFPEVFQAVSDNVQLIIVPANWPESRKEHWRTLLRARAIENQVFIAGINCVGDKGGQRYSGNSMVVDPEGQIIEELVKVEGLILAELEKSHIENYRKVFPCKKDRKINFYKNIIVNSKEEIYELE